MKLLTILSTSCLLTFATAGAVHADGPKTELHYAWTVGGISSGVTTFNEDGTCSNSLTTMRCVWEGDDPKRKPFTVSWGDGRFKDTLIVSEDENVMEGRNPEGRPIRGVRQADAARAGASVDMSAIIKKEANLTWISSQRKSCLGNERQIAVWELGIHIKGLCNFLRGYYDSVVHLAGGAFVTYSGDTCEVTENGPAPNFPIYKTYSLCRKPASDADQLAGDVWRTFDWAVGGVGNGVVTFNNNGSCSHSATPTSCVWFMDYPTVVVDWNDGSSNKDIMTLSLGNLVLEGKNEQGVFIQGLFKNGWEPSPARR